MKYEAFIPLNNHMKQKKQQKKEKRETKQMSLRSRAEYDSWTDPTLLPPQDRQRHSENTTHFHPQKPAIHHSHTTANQGSQESESGITRGRSFLPGECQADLKSKKFQRNELNHEQETVKSRIIQGENREFYTRSSARTIQNRRNERQKKVSEQLSLNKLNQQRKMQEKEYISAVE